MLYQSYLQFHSRESDQSPPDHRHTKACNQTYFTVSTPVLFLSPCECSDEERGERPGDPPSRFDPRLASHGYLQPISFDTPHAVNAALKRLSEHLPVLLRGTSLAQAFLKPNKNWAFEDLSAAVAGAGGKTEDVQVQCSDADTHRFLECEDRKNIAEGPYYIREPETQRLNMSISSFVQCSKTWTQRRLMLKVGFDVRQLIFLDCLTMTVRILELLERLERTVSMCVESNDNDTLSVCQPQKPSIPSSDRIHCLLLIPPNRQTQAEILRHITTNTETTTNEQEATVSSLHAPPEASLALKAVADAIKPLIDWPWLDRLLQSQRFGHTSRVFLEAGTAGGLQPTHYSTKDALLVQICGRRKILLFSPDWAFRGLYPYPCAHPYDKYSMVDVEKLDIGAWPAAIALQGSVALLQPGDVLHVPAYWFVHVQDLDPENICLKIEVHQGSRVPAKDAAPLRLSRALEERVATVEGIRGVKRWLSLIGSGKEWRAVDLGTVAGYRRALMCQDIRDEIEQTLGVGAWAALLPAVCDGRLTPTPWLNANFREPLLLKDTPVVVEDDRTEEERKYPQLFRRKLEAQGWKVPVSERTLRIPTLDG
jgi:hypothetical protein